MIPTSAADQPRISTNTSHLPMRIQNPHTPTNPPRAFRLWRNVILSRSGAQAKNLTTLSVGWSGDASGFALCMTWRENAASSMIIERPPTNPPRAFRLWRNVILSRSGAQAKNLTTLSVGWSGDASGFALSMTWRENAASSMIIERPPTNPPRAFDCPEPAHTPRLPHRQVQNSIYLAPLLPRKRKSSMPKCECSRM